MPSPLPVYVVHHPSLVDRRAALETSLAGLGWSATWITGPGITPLSYATGRTSARLSLAQASVYVKQLEALSRIAAAPEARALLLEDDPVFDPGFADTFAAYLAALPSDAEAAFFGASCGLEAPVLPANPRFALADRTRSLSVCVVTRAFARAVRDALANAPMTLPIDLAVDTVIRRTSMRVYWSVPAIVQNGSESGRFSRAVTKGAWRSLPLVQWLTRR